MNITDLKKDYCERNTGFKSPTVVVLHFRTPQDLRGARGARLTGTRIEVRRLFFLGADGYANCMSDPNAEAVGAYYSPHGMKRGIPLPVDQLDRFEIRLAPEVDHSKAWANIARLMRKHGVNLEMADAIDAHLSGKAPHITGCQNYWTRNDRPKIMDFSDMTNGQTIEELKKQMSLSQYGNMSYRRSRDGLRRDRSIELWIPKGSTHLRYSAASEYRGCGNGDYYIMFDDRRAFYAESD